MQKDENTPQVAVALGQQLGTRITGTARNQIRMSGNIAELSRDLLRSKHIIHCAGGDRVMRHPAKTSGGFILRERDAAFRLDGTYTDAAVRSVSRENDADGTAALHSGKRPEEDVDG